MARDASRQPESHGPKHTTPASASAVFSTSSVERNMSRRRGQRVVHATVMHTKKWDLAPTLIRSAGIYRMSV